MYDDMNNGTECGKVRSIGKFFKERKWRNDGYLTIEMTIIFPVIFFSLLLILFMGIVLYQEVEQQMPGGQASERGAVGVQLPGSDMSTGSEEPGGF